jgi:hypothetical protein
MPYRRRRDRLTGLGLEPDPYFVALAAPPTFQSVHGKYWPGMERYMEDALRSGRLPAYTEERCSQVKPLDKKALITNLTSSIAGSVGTAAAAAGATAGSTSIFAALAPAAPFLIIGAVALGVVAAIFAHHAKAVAQEQTTLCAAVPAANEALAWIDAEFAAGRMAKADASAALDTLYSNFLNYVGSVMKDTGDGKKCNYACGASRTLQAIVAKKKAQIAEAPDAMLATILNGDGWKGLLPWAIGGAILLKVAA